MEVRLARNKVGAGLQIREHEIFVGCVDARQSGEQLSQVDLRTADTTRDQIQSVDADPRHPASSFPEMETATAPPECVPS